MAADDREVIVRCPRCHNVVGLRENGTLRNHLGAGREVLCPEAGKRPPAQNVPRPAAKPVARADTDTCPKCGVRQKSVESPQCASCRSRSANGHVPTPPSATGGRDYPLTITDPTTGATRVVVIRAESYADAIKQAMTR